MSNQPRVFATALLVLGFTVTLLAQNSGTSGASSTPSSQSTPPAAPSKIGVGGLTIHTKDSGKEGTQQVTPTTPAANASGVVQLLAEANRLFSVRQIPEALARYQAVIKADPKVAPALVGVMRCLLMLDKLDEALAAEAKAVVAAPASAQVLATAADVLFRGGQIPESEKLYLKSAKLNPSDPEPYIGLWRIYKAYTLNRRAYDNLKRAHEVAPNNGPVQMLYFHSLPQADRIAELRAYLTKPNLNPQISRSLQGYLAYLQKSAAQPVHACKIVSNVQRTETKLRPIARGDTKLGAIGLDVKINKQEVHLALDTGATGILLGRATSEKLGLQKLGYQSIIGMGDKGVQGGFTAVAERIRIGDLEFQDCIVKVTDAATPVTGQDGLIGADVFSAYLIDIDTPSAKLRLSPLPQRPNESEEPATLQTMAQDQPDEASNDAAEGAKSGLNDMPKDAYVAPEMKNWTKAFRFRSLLLVPTYVDKSGPLLFLIDTGSFSNILSTRAASQVTQVRSDPGMQVRGMSGNVGQVYRADKATLQFGRYEQQNEDVTTFDISAVSKQTGTEVSGILGFKMLCILKLKIDYRDGLVDFIFDPNHLPKQIRIGR
jgi:tetratricopeptide (TPR) repeat protein